MLPTKTKQQQHKNKHKQRSRAVIRRRSFGKHKAHIPCIVLLLRGLSVVNDAFGYALDLSYMLHREKRGKLLLSYTSVASLPRPTFRSHAWDLFDIRTVKTETTHTHAHTHTKHTVQTSASSFLIPFDIQHKDVFFMQNTRHKQTKRT